MAVRGGMANLILRTRRLIQDVSVTAPVFLDQEVQDKLDQYRFYQRYVRLTPQATIQPGGKRLWTDFFSEFENWEETGSGSEFSLVDATYNVLTPDSSDYISGHWTFNAGVNNAVVWITGQSYDIYAAGADLASDWAGIVKLQFDFSDNNVQYKRNQQFEALLQLSEKLREKALPRRVSMGRQDVTQNVAGSGFFGNPNEVNQGVKQ